MANDKRCICHVIEASATGTLSMASLLANVQIEAGHEVEIVYSRRPETPSNIESHFSEGITLTNVQMGSLLEKYTSIFALRRHMLSRNPDVIFLHSSFAGFIGRMALLGSAVNARIYYLPHCISFMRKDVSRLKRYIFILLEWLAAIKQGSYVACSRSEQVEIRKAIPFRPCLLVENAVELESRPSTARVLHDRLVVITVGQLRPQKDPERFARIAEAGRRHGLPLDFVWIGDGDPALRKALEGAGVVVTGWLDKQAVMARLAEADIYLSTSRWEGMPVSLIEAQLSNVPVIASDCAGNIDCIEDGVNGWLYSSIDEAVEILKSVASDSDYRARVSLVALNLASDRFAKSRYKYEMNELVQ